MRSLCARSAFAKSYLVGLSHNPQATPFELLALLLLAAPEELTLQKLLELPVFGERVQRIT